MFRRFLSLTVHDLFKFEVLIQVGFQFIQKITIYNLCKQFHDVIVIPFSISS